MKDRTGHWKYKTVMLFYISASTMVMHVRGSVFVYDWHDVCFIVIMNGVGAIGVGCMRATLMCYRCLQRTHAESKYFVSW